MVRIFFLQIMLVSVVVCFRAFSGMLFGAFDEKSKYASRVAIQRPWYITQLAHGLATKTLRSSCGFCPCQVLIDEIMGVSPLLPITSVQLVAFERASDLNLHSLGNVRSSLKGGLVSVLRGNVEPF